MRVGLAIPTLNAGAYIGPLVQAVMSQTLRPSRLQVVDSSSDDGSVERWLDAGFDVEVISREEFDHGRTRNLAARLLGDVDVFAFLTQDALPAGPDWLQKLVHPIANGAAAAFSRQVPRVGAGRIESYARAFNYPISSRQWSLADAARLGVKAYFFSNVASAVTRSALESVGGFDEGIILNEDMMLARRLLENGNAIAYAADSVVVHSHSYTLREQFARNFDIGVFFAQRGHDLPLTRTSEEGLRYLRGLIRHLMRSGSWDGIPVALADTAVRFIAYQIGRRERLLPLPIKRSWSMHKRFWRT